MAARAHWPVTAVPAVAAVVAVVAVVAVMALGAGCSDAEPGLPEVTFTADGATVMAMPTQYCDVDVQECDAYPQAAVAMAVPGDAELAVSVPEAVSEAPWQVVFRYRDAGGKAVQGRSTVLAGGQPDYVLRLDKPGAQLETVEVQQFGAAMVPREDGVDFATRATWVLSVDDR